MIMPVWTALVQPAQRPARVRRQGGRHTIADGASLEEGSSDPMQTRVSLRPPGPAGLDGSGGRSAPRTVAAEFLAVLMTLRHGG